MASITRQWTNNVTSRVVNTQGMAGRHEARQGGQDEAAQRHHGRLVRIQKAENPEDQGQDAQGEQPQNGDDPLGAALELGEGTTDVRAHRRSSIACPRVRRVVHG